jgi:divalent metal cation (Fe/Co/Zn/Cd) transporter
MLRLPVSAAEPVDDGAPLRLALRLEFFTAGWNTLEAAVAVVAGIAAGSVALVGFGLDSIIETMSAGILIWRLRVSEERSEAAERRALKAVGITFFLLAAYILYESGSKLLLREPPRESIPGIVLALVALVVMLWLRAAKRRAAARIGSAALAADAAESGVCAWLSGALLIGLGLNALFGWWWADPVAALAMLPIVIREGLEAIRGEECGCCGEG